MRLAVVFFIALVTSLAIACTDDDDPRSAGPGRVPTPSGAVIRQNCETIAATEYFLNDEERTWFRDNCNRLDCRTIRGTQYVSVVEREWYLENCT